MRISNIEISNYRNLDGIKIDFNSETNFIIGENNLGKSNLLLMLDTVFSGKGFSDSDFYETTKAIEIKIQLKLLENEIGFLGDNFSVEDATVVNIRVVQTSDEVYPTLICSDTEEMLPLKLLKKLHYIYYSSTLNPTKELKIDGRGGASTLINFIIKKYVKEVGTFSVLEESKMNSIKGFINEIFAKIHSIKDYALSVNVTDKSDELISKLLYLEDTNGAIDSAGSGIKYITMASINVLCQIMDIYNSKTLKFGEQIYTDESGKKYLPIIIAIDEPEVHLNPFTQRSLVKYYQKIINNRDEDFLSLVKSLFDIDGINGQLIIVTHSTDLLIGGYKNIIRFYRNADKMKVVSGKNITLNSAEEKQLLMNFPELKTTFYAKSVVFVEGESEFGCLNLFAEKMGIDFDEYGICLINAEGEKNIRGMRNLLSYFGIPSVAIYDNDVNTQNCTDENIFYTSELCFESEITSMLLSFNRIDIARQLVSEMEPAGEKLVLDADFVRKWYKKRKLDLNNFTPITIEDISDTDNDKCLDLFSAWLYSRKSILMGRMLGRLLDLDLIPQSYKNVINKAKEVASNGQ